MEQRGLRPRDSRAGAGVGEPGYLLARPERARDDGHPRAGLRGAEAEVAACDGEVREDRMLRPHRTRGGERSWILEYDRCTEKRRLRAERREEVDRQRLLLGRGRDLRPLGSPPELRLPRRSPPPRLPCRPYYAQSFPARCLANGH